MPLPKPAFFQSDNRPQWRSALAGLAVGLRLRFRKNPGFTMATAAGSIGLLLALFLLLSGGLSRFSKSDAEQLEEVANLGDEEGKLPAKDTGAKKATTEKENGTLASLEENRPYRPSPRREASPPERSRSHDDSFLSDDEPSEADSADSVVSRANDSRSTKLEEEEPAGDPFNTDSMTASREEKEEEPEEEPISQPVKPVTNSAAIAGLHGDVEEGEAETDDSIATAPKDESRSPLIEEETTEDESAVAVKDEPIATKVSKPAKKPERLFSDDEPIGSSSEDEEPQPASRPTTTTIVKTPVKSSPPVPPIREADDGSFVPPQSKSEESGSPTTQPKSGWKYSTTKPQDPPRESIGRSQAVETAVYAAPESTPAAPAPKRVPDPTPSREIPPVEKKANAPLALAIKAPRNVSPGQAFDIEFTVTNTSRETVRGVILSVLLPAGLSHDLGPELEQPIESLTAGQTHRARLRVKATGAGDVTPRADVAIKGQPRITSTTTLRVGSTGGTSTSTIPPCACEPDVRYVW